MRAKERKEGKKRITQKRNEAEDFPFQSSTDFKFCEYKKLQHYKHIQPSFLLVFIQNL